MWAIAAGSIWRTREAIVVAATGHFLERGYEGTSLTDITARAGVARPTVVAAFGTKPALLSRVLGEAMAGDDEPVPVRDRPWFRSVWEATTAVDALRAYAHVGLVIGSLVVDRGWDETHFESWLADAMIRLLL